MGTPYERSAIEGWILRRQAAGQAPCSPLTNQPLEGLSVTPNHTLRRLIERFRHKGLLD